MKSKSLLLLLFIGFSFALNAQSISVKSFKLLPTDMTASSLEGKRIDQNNEVAALIKMVTTQTGFTFEAGALGIVDTRQEAGEVWVWVPRGSRKITIKHPQLGVLREYRYPIEILPERTYEMQLTTSKVVVTLEEEIQQQYLTFQISPANAMLEVNGQLWEVGRDGSATKFVDLGTYKYRVQAPNYHSDAGMVTADEPGGKKQVTITLKPDFVEVTLKADTDAEIWVNNEKKGVGTWTGPLGKGTYMIECKKANHETSRTSQEITDALNGSTITLPAPQPIYGSLNIESTPNYATVYLDGKPMGETPLFIKEVLIGTHELKLTKEGHNDYTETLTLMKGERKQVKAEMNNADYDKIALKGDEYFDAKNYEEALKCYRQAAEHGNAVGQNGMGKLYSNGYIVQQDYSEAAKWYRKAAEQGLVNAQCNLGWMYQRGQGVAQNNTEAVKWFRRAAEKDYPFGLNALGWMYENGYGVSEDDIEAVKWYRKAADIGDARGQNNLGAMYGMGKGVPQDDTEAAKWYRKAAEQGDANGQYLLGYYISEGSYNEEDFIEAVKWYKKSADQGNSNGQYGLGMAYFYGDGVQQNTKEGLKWLHLSAEQKHPDAAYELSTIYREGKNGVKADQKKADEWYEKARDYGWY